MSLNQSILLKMRRLKEMTLTGARETADQVGVHSALAEDLGLVPSIHAGQLSCLYITLAPVGDDTLSGTKDTALSFSSLPPHKNKMNKQANRKDTH